MFGELYRCGWKSEELRAADASQLPSAIVDVGEGGGDGGLCRGLGLLVFAG